MRSRYDPRSHSTGSRAGRGQLANWQETLMKESTERQRKKIKNKNEERGKKWNPMKARVTLPHLTNQELSKHKYEFTQHTRIRCAVNRFGFVIIMFQDRQTRIRVRKQDQGLYT